MKKSVVMALGAVMLLFLASSVYASVEDGRQALFKENPIYQDFLDAHGHFKDALASNPNDPEANLFYSVTSLAAFVLEPDEDLEDIFYAFGLRGPKLERYLHEGFAYDVIEEPDPKDYPSVSDLQIFLCDPYMDLLDHVWTSLDKIPDDFSTVLTTDETGAEFNITVDHGEVLLYKSMIKANKFLIYVTTSYDLDIDIVEIAKFLIYVTTSYDLDIDISYDLDIDIEENALELEEKGEELPQGYINDLLEANPEFLTLVQNRLNSAKQALLEAIGLYFQASQFIREERDRASYYYLISFEEYLEIEKFFREILDELRESILDYHKGAELGDPEDLFVLNLSPFFGDYGDGPFDLRDFLPKFDQYNHPVSGTVGHGLDNDPTLGGIFPGLTQADWGIDTHFSPMGMPWIYLLLDDDE